MQLLWPKRALNQVSRNMRSQKNPQWKPKQVKIDPNSFRAETAVADVDASPWELRTFSSPFHPVDASDTDGESSLPQSGVTSIAGDTNVTETDDEKDPSLLEARDRDRNAPSNKYEGNPPEDRSRARSSQWNQEPEVGNFGLYFGNWGTTSEKGKEKKRREQQVKQITKNPGNVLVVLESTAGMEAALRLPAVAGQPSAKGVAARPTSQYFVQRGKEAEAAVLIAARTDTCICNEQLNYDIHRVPYTKGGKSKNARSRMLTCKIHLKQNIGHIGKEVVVMGAHGNFELMKFKWPEELDKLLNRFVTECVKYSVQFVCIDANMFLTQLVPTLRSRGFDIVCIAWYPWLHDSLKCNNQALGFDSCGIFWVGSKNCQITMPWNISHLPILTAVAGDTQGFFQEQQKKLDVYRSPNVPGQHWRCYRIKKTECEADKDLAARLRDLLTPQVIQNYLDALPKRNNSLYCPYLRFKQKNMTKEEWLVNGEVHGGAHFPLCVWTNNARARSVEGEEKREEKRRAKKAAGKGCGKGDMGKHAGKDADGGGGAGEGKCKGCRKGDAGKDAGKDTVVAGYRSRGDTAGRDGWHNNDRNDGWHNNDRNDGWRNYGRNDGWRNDGAASSWQHGRDTYW
jgi:hypothetical protein